jgi:hypothetical protein
MSRYWPIYSGHTRICHLPRNVRGNGWKHVAEAPLLEKKGSAQQIQEKQKTKEEEVSNFESTTEQQQEKLAIVTM